MVLAAGPASQRPRSPTLLFPVSNAAADSARSACALSPTGSRVLSNPSRRGGTSSRPRDEVAVPWAMPGRGENGRAFRFRGVDVLELDASGRSVA